MIPAPRKSIPEIICAEILDVEFESRPKVSDHLTTSPWEICAWIWVFSWRYSYFFHELTIIWSPFHKLSLYGSLSVLYKFLSGIP